MRVRATIVALTAILGGTWVFAAPASALQPGVSVAPGSPAGREYSFPLSVLRAAAVGHPAVQGQAEPLFGAGIAPAAVGSVRGQGGQTSSTGSNPRRALGTTASSSSTRSTPSNNRTIARSLIPPASSAPDVALIVGAVLLAGAALGAMLAAVLRRRHD
jgi:hypothetical protein